MSQKTKTEQKRLRGRIGLRAHLIALMLLLLTVFLLVTGLFQILLLDVLYESVRRNELEKTADRVIADLGQESLQNTVYECAMEGMLSVAIYRIEGDRGVLVASEHATGESGKQFFIEHEQLSYFYEKAQQEEGAYHTQVTFGGREVDRPFLAKLLFFWNQRGEQATEMLNMVYVRLHEDAAQNQYMMVFHASMAPLTVTVLTLQRQFIWIFGIMLVLTLLLVGPITRRLTRPISHMNEAAKQLAEGNYNADFEGEFDGYRETRELAEALNHAAGEIAKSDRLQKELVANISHDLRTPLTMIRGYAEVMRDIPGENTPENLQVLIDETAYLSELVNDLLDLSKLQAGMRSPVMEFFDLSAAVLEVMGRYEVFTKTQGYQIRTEIHEAAPVVADRNMILQVVYNLINNAIHYTGEDLNIFVKQEIRDGKVYFSVSDTGEGIPEDQIPQIWDRYYKVDRVHRASRIGTGLGLSIVKGILEVHHAEYGVESKMGEGSTFWFALPISELPTEEEKTI